MVAEHGLEFFGSRPATFKGAITVDLSSSRHRRAEVADQGNRHEMLGYQSQGLLAPFMMIFACLMVTDFPP
jgi:hypothetical protein